MAFIQTRNAKALILFCATVMVFATFAPFAAAADDPDKLIFGLKPYVWFPTIEADLRYTSLPNGSGGSPELKVEPDDWFHNLDMAALLLAEVRKGKWSLVADFTYLDLSGSDSEVKRINFGGSVIDRVRDVGTDVDVKSVCSTFGAGYNLVSGKAFKTDLVAGVRYLWLEAKTEWELSTTIESPEGDRTFARQGKIKADDEFWNGIVGARGSVGLGDSNWSIPFYVDIGTGDCDLTWQFFSALAYSFGSWDVELGYRYMEFDAKDDDDLIQELKFSGPILGARFEF